MIKRDMILDRKTLKKGETHSRPGPLGESSAVSKVYSYSFGLHRYLINKSDHNDKLLSTEATFGFCLL